MQQEGEEKLAIFTSFLHQLSSEYEPRYENGELVMQLRRMCN